MIIAATRYGSSSGGGGSGSLRYTVISGADPTYFVDTETGDWELVFLSSSRIKFTSAPSSVEVFAVGGGAKGYDGSVTGATANGGVGGAGGACVTDTKSVTVGTEYQVDIGASGQSSSAFGVTAASGGGSSGGAGASAIHGGGGSVGGNGSQGSLAFGRLSATTGRTQYEASLDQQGQDPVVIYFGAGGGGGGAWRGTDNASSPRGTGGTTGGGTGGKPATNTDYAYSAGESGTANTGSGGGGGGAVVYGYGSGNGLSGGLGGSGIVIIRNARAST